MKKPSAFKTAQKQIFQDKSVEHYLPIQKTGSLGSKTSEPAETPAGSYYFNFRIISDAVKAKEWGLEVGKDATASTSDVFKIAKGDYFKYLGSFYRVTSIQPHDSYMVYLCKAVE